MIIAILSVLGYVIIGVLLYFVVEPWLRLRKDITLVKDTMDQEMIRTIGSLFWPLAMIFYPLLRFIIIPFFQYLSHLSDLADNYWSNQPVKPVIESDINAGKTGYRNVEYKKIRKSV